MRPPPRATSIRAARVSAAAKVVALMLAATVMVVLTVVFLVPRFLGNMSPGTAPVEEEKDSSRIAFESYLHRTSDIYTMKADGTDLIRLTNHRGDEWFPTWSPDGEKIAFVSSRGGYDDIYTMSADGTGVVRLTDHPELDGSPTWQPVD